MSMNDLIFAVIDTLKANAILNSAVGGKISYRKGEMKEFPYVVLDIITNTSVLATDPTCDVESTLVQVSVYTDDFYPKRGLEIMAMVEDTIGRRKNLTFSGSDPYHFIGSWPQGESVPELIKTSVNESGYWRVTSDYMFKYQK